MQLQKVQFEPLFRWSTWERIFHSPSTAFTGSKKNQKKNNETCLIILSNLDRTGSKKALDH